MILVGELALWVALLMAAWGAIVSFAGGRTGRADLSASGVRAIYAAFACAVLAASGLVVALASSDFAFRFVASFTSANLPFGYKLAALWSGPAGSLVFCTLVLSTFAAIAVASRARNAEPEPYVAGALSAIMLAFVGTLCFAANPYERILPVPVEGQGMYPLLQHSGFVLHAPMLYLGVIAACVPFALAVGALAARRIDNDRLLAVRKWSIVSWFLLTIAIIVGMWWAYVEVGDGGHWTLDPVRNLSILPWLTTGALLVSTRSHDRRGAPGRGSIVLAAASFLLAVLGMFIVRGGIISMNPVASWSGVAGWFTAFLALGTVIVAYLLVTRLARLALPTLMNRDVGEKRGQYGRYAVQAGLALFVAGLGGTLFTEETGITLGAGETATLSDAFGDRLDLTSQGVSRFDVLNRHVVAVALQTAADGKATDLITSEERQYFDSRGAHTFPPTTEAGIDYSLKQDVYVVLTGVMGDRAQVRVAFHPLVMWVWLGGALVAIGGAVAAWPSRIAGTPGAVSAAVGTRSETAEATA